MAAYRATVRPDPASPNWLLVEVDGVGTTQARTPDDAEDAARGLVAALRDLPLEDVDVAVTVTP